MSIATQRRAAAGFPSLSITRPFALSREHIRTIYISLMGLLVLECLSNMVIHYSSGPVTVLRAGTAVLGIWLGKTWKDKGFRIMACYLLWMVLRICIRIPSMGTVTLKRLVALFWAFGGCYSLGRILSRKELTRFLSVVCFLWTLGMVVSSCLGITAAWMRIRIPNITGTATWRIWGDASSARLNLIYCSTTSGGILSLSILAALLAGLQARKPAMRAFFFTACFPMTLALCLTDSRVAQVSIAAGIAVLSFLLAFTRLRSGRFLKSGFISGSAAVKPWKTALLLAGSALVFVLVFRALLQVNPLFDAVKIASARLGILPSGAVTGDTTILMAHRGLQAEDALTGRDQIWRAVFSYLSTHTRYLLYGVSILNPMARINDQSILAFETSHCHNIVLQVLLEGGIPALLLFGGFLVFLGRKAFRLCTGRNKPVWLVLLPCLILSILAGEMAECHTLFVFTYSPVPFALFLAAGFIAASDTAGESENRRVKFRSCLVFPAICAAVMCIAALFVLNSSVPVVNQADYDDPAADLFYSCGDENCETHGGSHTIYTSGCGLCAVSNAVRYMTGQGIDVRELAAFARENEQYVVHLGSKGTMTESVAEAFGEEYGFAYLGKAGSLAEATDYIKMGCTVIAGVGNSSGGGHLLVIADYDPLTKQYLILDSAGSSDSWSRSFSSWQRIRGDCLSSNPDVTFTSFRILGPSRLESYID